MRCGLYLLVATACFSDPCWAAESYLACESFPGQSIGALSTESIAIDFEKKTVRIANLTYHFVTERNDFIRFTAPVVFDGFAPGVAVGWINRITGETDIYSYRSATPNRWETADKWLCVASAPRF